MCKGRVEEVIGWICQLDSHTHQVIEGGISEPGEEGKARYNQDYHGYERELNMFEGMDEGN